MKKFELTSETKAFWGKTLYRIRALISFGNVSAGDLGGFVEKEENLDQSGDAWVSGDAMVDKIGAIFWSELSAHAMVRLHFSNVKTGRSASRVVAFLAI